MDAAEISDAWIKLDWNRTIFSSLMKEYKLQNSKRHESNKLIPSCQMGYFIQKVKFK
uniref:Uncharacterized protein n=2 Tax=Schistosoma mansoni TaxID=6183 RepID=A0A5K4FAD3_SCHMA